MALLRPLCVVAALALCLPRSAALRHAPPRGPRHLPVLPPWAMDAPAAAAAQAGSKDDADFDREDDVKVASSLMKGAAGPPQHLCVFTASNYFLSRHYLFVLLLLPLPLSSWRVFARS